MIVVGGEALVDLVPDQSTMDCEGGALLPRMGGGPYNVAIALGRLGAPVAFLSRISTDSFGDALIDRLCSSNVDTSLVQRGAEPTTLAVVGLGADGSARYSFYVEGTADRLVTDPGPLPVPARAVSLGTLSMVLEPGASVYESVLCREFERGLLTVLDPNVRPVLIAGTEAYRRRFRSWLPHVGLLKLSLDDARWLAGDLGEDDDPLPAVHEWRKAGPVAVVLTRGGDGMAALTATDGLVEVPGVPVDVVDTIGAGDTVQGALLAWLHSHDALSVEAIGQLSAGQWRSALGFAASAAAITCSRAGAEPPYSSEIAKE